MHLEFGPVGPQSKELSVNQDSSLSSASNGTVSSSNQFYFGVLGCRLIALWLIATGFVEVTSQVVGSTRQLRAILAVPGQFDFYLEWLAQVLRQSGGLIIGAVYWWGAEGISRRMFWHSPEGPQGFTIDYEGWMSLFLSAVGAANFVSGVAKITNAASWWLSPAPDTYGSVHGVHGEVWRTLGEGTVILLLSFGLLFGSRRIGRFLLCRSGIGLGRRPSNTASN